MGGLAHDSPARFTDARRRGTSVDPSSRSAPILLPALQGEVHDDEHDERDECDDLKRGHTVILKWAVFPSKLLAGM